MDTQIPAVTAQDTSSVMEVRHILHIIRCGLRVIYVILNNLYTIPSYLLWCWLFLFPIRVVHPNFFWYLEGKLLKWMLCSVASWSWFAKYYIVEVGEDITSCLEQRCLILVNHQSTSDVPLLMTAFQNRNGVLEGILWIMDHLFRYTNFGLVSATRGDFFITQGKNVRFSQLKSLEDHLFNVYMPRTRQWLVLFPEGGFLRKRRETSQRYAKANNYPFLQHVTLPRVGAMYTIINSLRPGKLEENLKQNRNTDALDDKQKEPLRWVIDITIGYPDGGKPLDLPTICSSYRPPCTTYFHYRCYPIDDVPEDMESMKEWLYDRWVEKENLLDEYYKTGKFPHKSVRGDNNSNNYKLMSQPTKVIFNDFYIAFCHLFYVVSSFLHYYILGHMWQFVY